MKFTFKNDEKLQSIFDHSRNIWTGMVLIQDEKAGVYVTCDKAQRDEEGKKIRRYAAGFCASVSPEWTTKVEGDDFMVAIPVRIVHRIQQKLKLPGITCLDIKTNAKSTTFAVRR